jgi:hypothetical protein
MAIKLIANYSKRLGLPGYSSHQFSVSVETELVTTDDLPGESARLYQMLQSNVDGQIQATGFVPPTDYGLEPPANGSPHSANGNGNANGNAIGNTNPNPHPATPLGAGRWKCSDKQGELILNLVEEHALDKHAIEALAIERFGKGVRQLNKIEASGLIDELLDTYGHGSSGGRSDGRSGGRRAPSAYRRSAGSGREAA